MASFVEQATLRVDNQASKEIRGLNKDILNLLRNARKINKLKIDFGKDIARSQRQLSGLARSLNALPRSRTVSINVQQNGTVPRIPRANPIAPPVPNQPPVPPGRNNNNRNSAAYGIFRAAAALGAFTLATSAATSALSKITREAAARDRTGLLLSAGATPGQRAIIERAPVPEGQGPIRLSVDERRRLAQSLLGDVRGDGDQRAVSATNIAAQLEREVLPRLFAGQPDKSRDQVLGSLRDLVVGMNLASSDLVDDTGKLTKDAQRVLDAQLIAITADPSVTPESIKTVLANLKTSAFQLDTDALARVLINSGARGQRVGNEAFRTQAIFQGTTDVKVLNNKLAELGLLLDVERNAKGNVIAGSGTPVEEQLLATNFPLWLDKYVTVPMEKALAKITPETPATNAERVAYLNKILAGASSAGKQGTIDTILGDDQARAALSQASMVVQQGISQALETSWTAQMNNVTTAFTDATAAFGASVASFTGAAEKLAYVANLIRDNPNATAATAAGVGVGATVLTGRWIASLFDGGGAGGAGSGASRAGATVAGTLASGAARVASLAGLAIAAYSGAKSIAAPGKELVDDTRMFKFGVDDLARWLLGTNKPPAPEASKTITSKEVLTQAVMDAQERLSFAKQSGDINLVPQLQTELQSAQLAISTFDQTFQTGAQTASTTISTGLETGANILTGGLASAFSAGADVLAARITAAINSATINAPRQPSAVPAANTGVTAPTE